MQYLLGFLTIVIHAGENNTKRYADLISRGQQTFLHGIQHVIVHGGTGPGTLRNHSLPLSDPRSYVETTDAALLQDAPVYGDIVPSTAPGIVVSNPGMAQRDKEQFQIPEKETIQHFPVHPEEIPDQVRTPAQHLAYGYFAPPSQRCWN